jgi:hypothetical protein
MYTTGAQPVLQRLQETFLTGRLSLKAVAVQLPHGMPQMQQHSVAVHYVCNHCVVCPARNITHGERWTQSLQSTAINLQRLHLQQMAPTET